MADERQGDRQADRDHDAPGAPVTVDSGTALRQLRPVAACDLGGCRAVPVVEADPARRCKRRQVGR
jgi:hypothetical protein